jgi:hypothetical protein
VNDPANGRIPSKRKRRWDTAERKTGINDGQGKAKWGGVKLSRERECFTGPYTNEACAR